MMTAASTGQVVCHSGADLRHGNKCLAVTFQGSDTAFPRGRDGHQALQIRKPVTYTVM